MSHICRTIKNDASPWFRRFFRDQKGASIVEFAIILPVFISFIFGCIEFGFIMWGRISLEYATSAAARYAYVNKTASTSAIVNYAKGLVPSNYPGRLNFSFAVSTASNTATITGTYTYTFFVLPLSAMTMTTSVVQPTS